MSAHQEKDPNAQPETGQRELEEIERRRLRREQIRENIRRAPHSPPLAPALTNEPELLPVDEEQVDAAIAWLQEKWGEQRACPYCGNTQWAIGPPVQFLVEGEPGISPPFFNASCTNCGNTALVNAMFEGIDSEAPE